MRLAPLSLAAPVVAMALVAALPAAAGPPSPAGPAGGGAAQAPGCVPVPAAECGSVRVPLFRSRPAGPKIDIGYVLIRHRDAALPVARGTVVFNPGGPGAPVIDERGDVGRSLRRSAQRPRPAADRPARHADARIRSDCGLTALPATRKGFVRAVGALRADGWVGRRVRTPRRRRPTTSRRCASTWASRSSTSTACRTAPT